MMIKEAPASARGAAVERTTPPAGGRFVLGRRASLLVSAGVVSHKLWTNAGPALTYGLYAREWELTHTVTGGSFVPFSLLLLRLALGLGGNSASNCRSPTLVV